MGPCFSPRVHPPTILFIDCDAGCNLICTALHRVLHRLFKMHVPVGARPHIEHFTIQVDNCVSENKNHILLGYLGSLVVQGIIGEVEVQFMPVGHTHIKIDQVFSRCVWTVDSLCTVSSAD